MAVGDDATAGGYTLVPDSGEEGRVRWGSREINRTRDFVAQVKALIPGAPSAWRQKAGITSGTTDPNPANGVDGDIYFKIVG
jgi:hypothetical protein